MSNNVTINDVRISYPHLFQAKQINNQGDPKFSAAFIIKADNPGLKLLVEKAKTLVAEKYPGGTPHNFKQLPLAKGEDKYPGNADYVGTYVLNTSKGAAQGRPSVVDQHMQEVIDPGKVYPGMVVNVAISVYTYANVSKGVTTGLEAVQLVRDGDRLDNKPSVDELFKPLDVPGESGGAAGGFDPLA